ncbi:MAG: riboflavin biosynthesis protein RibF [Elusimicrobiales bacterium]|jgi:riboflavin kinase/FMN adenylyltransferase
MSVFLTIGTFDGVHLGHQKIIRALIREGLKRGMAGALAYFPFPPKLFFSGETADCLITLPEERAERIRNLRVENITEIPFDSALAAMSAEKFFNDIILKAHDCAGLCVGRDFAFGHNRRGGLEFLRKHCAAAGIYFKAMSFVSLGGRKISSSLIRALLRKGGVEEANKCLGWNYSVSGKVVRGAGMGRRLGFPTANLAVHPAKILPPGVFAAKITLGGGSFCGVVNVGRRPTVDGLGGRLLTEAHLLDFDREIYGRTLGVEFLKYLRSEKKFSSKEALRRGIVEDLRAAVKYFKTS